MAWCLVAWLPCRLVVWPCPGCRTVCESWLQDATGNSAVRHTACPVLLQGHCSSPTLCVYGLDLLWHRFSFSHPPAVSYLIKIIYFDLLLYLSALLYLTFSPTDLLCCFLPSLSHPPAVSYFTFSHPPPVSCFTFSLIYLSCCILASLSSVCCVVFHLLSLPSICCVVSYLLSPIHLLCRI